MICSLISKSPFSEALRCVTWTFDKKITWCLPPCEAFVSRQMGIDNSHDPSKLMINSISKHFFCHRLLCRKPYLSFGTVLQKFDYLYKDPGCHRIPLTQDTAGEATEPVLIVMEVTAACQVFFKQVRRL